MCVCSICRFKDIIWTHPLYYDSCVHTLRTKCTQTHRETRSLMPNPSCLSMNAVIGLSIFDIFPIFMEIRCRCTATTTTKPAATKTEFQMKLFVCMCAFRRVFNGISIRIELISVLRTFPVLYYIQCVCVCMHTCRTESKHTCGKIIHIVLIFILPPQFCGGFCGRA